MSAQLHLAKAEHLETLLPLVEAFHYEMALGTSAEQRHAGIAPLLEGGPLGAAYLLGPVRAPMGYVVVTFGWSVEFGGMDCFLDEIYIRPTIRGRGIATEAINDLCKTLAQAEVRAMHLEVDRDDDRTQRLYTRARFKRRDRFSLMTRVL